MRNGEEWSTFTVEEREMVVEEREMVEEADRLGVEDGWDCLVFGETWTALTRGWPRMRPARDS